MLRRVNALNAAAAVAEGVVAVVAAAAVFVATCLLVLAIPLLVLQIVVLLGAAVLPGLSQGGDAGLGPVGWVLLLWWHL